MRGLHLRDGTTVAERAPSAVERGRTPPITRIAYVVSRFPKLTETFVLYELLALEELGYIVELYPLLREPETVVHPEAVRLVQTAHYEPFLSLSILRSQLWFVFHRPRAYFAALLALARGTLGSANYFFGGLAIFPKVAHFARAMERIEVEHVHCHFANHPAAAGFLVHRLTGIPFSFTAHGSDLHRDQHMLKPKVDDAAIVVTISEYNRRLIAAECGAAADAKIEVVHYGTDTELFAPAPEPTARPVPVVVCVASFEEVKGHEHLLRACALLVEEGLELTCRLIGDGPLRPRIESLVRELGLEDLVVLEGRRRREEVAGLLREADVAVTPSVPTPQGDREGMPLALIEAMASGVPVIASDISGIPELVVHEGNGLLVPPGDVAALRAALRRLLDNAALRARLGTNGRATIIRGFDIRRNAARLARTLEAVHA
jgi:glycosyltransferase involved in cell wall biosynthesis